MREGQGLIRREIAGVVVCVLFSLVAFAGLAVLVEAGRLPAILALAIALACPVVWLALLAPVAGGGTGSVVWKPLSHRLRGARIRVPASGTTQRRTSREDRAA